MSHDRELRLARVAYIGGVRRLDVALRRFDVSDIPMDPGPPGREPFPWTADHVALMKELVEAFTAVFDRRCEWDRLRDEWTPPH